MRPLLATILATCAILAASQFPISQAAPPESHSVRPTSTPVVHPAGCSCGAMCECDRLRDALEVARNEIRTLKLQSAPVAVVKVATDSKVVAQQPVCGPGGCQPARQVATAPRRVVVQKPQQNRWYPGKRLGR